MDNLTHSLVGFCMSRAGLNRFAPDATPILLVAANAPDLDIVSGLHGFSSYLHWHRHWTHSLPFSIVVAVASVALVRAFTRRKGNWVGAIAIAWLGVLSHILLDLTNNYGVRVLEPFSGRWFAWDLTYVVDPYLWGALLLAVFAPLLGRVLSSEMGSRKGRYPARGWAAFALVFLTLFECGRWVIHNRAVSILESRLYSGEASRRVAAFPTPLNPLAWQGYAETDGQAFLFTLDLAGDFDPNAGRAFYKNNPGNAAAVLRKTRDFGTLIEFAQYPLWRVIEDENNSVYRLTDLRFGDPVAQTFTCSARLLTAFSASDERCDFTFAPKFGKD